MLMGGQILNAYTVDEVSFEAISKALGSQMRGFNASTSYKSTHVQKLIEAWHSGLVCRIRNQCLSKNELIKFSHIFGLPDVTDVATCPGSIHPIIQQHPVTGKNFLYLGRRLNAYVVGYSVADSEALLNKLWRYTQSPEFSWTQHWAVGDILIWDNRCTMHRRDSFDENTRRVMWRTQIQSNPECRR